MSENSERLRVDIVSDVVCPWCVIGWRQLAKAFDETGIEADIHWHPFELNPQMAPEGENLREHLAAKYGTTPEGSRQARARLTQMGKDLGFAFNYADDMRTYNTFKAHQLIHWAETLGRAHAMKQALFAAFFTDRADVSDTQKLVEVAASVGLDPLEAQAVLADGRFANDVREAQTYWTSLGVDGVPAIVFAGKYLATGAHGTENYRAILDRITETETV